VGFEGAARAGIAASNPVATALAVKRRLSNSYIQQFLSIAWCLMMANDGALVGQYF